MNNPFKYLLLPFSWLYGLIVIIRNILYDLSILKSRQFGMPVIGIGNLSAGGTGKTPMAEYLLKTLLENGYNPALLSRGYKRQSSGYMEVETISTANMAGDEPCQVKRKFPNAVVSVCEDRITGIDNICALHKDVDVIVLDDSYQHRKVKPGFNILLTDYNRPYYNDLLLPSGLLREPIWGRKRADVIIATKCPPSILPSEKLNIKTKLIPKDNQKVFFTSIGYHAFHSISSNRSLELNDLQANHILLFTGIANTQPLEKYLDDNGINFQLIRYPDHHNFSLIDIKKIISDWKTIATEHKILLTTEKDWRRLEGSVEAELLAGLPLYYLPIEVKWDAPEKVEFDKMILNYVGRNRRSR